jgi:hypothetical protein
VGIEDKLFQLVLIVMCVLVGAAMLRYLEGE